MHYPDDLPEVGEVVVVRTRLHSGETALVTEVAPLCHRSRRTYTPRRFVRLQGIDGSLYGAEGWYEPHEFDSCPFSVHVRGPL